MRFGLQNPLWLAALAVLVPLVWLHLRPRTKPPAEVSSLFLWKRATPESPPARRRPRLPLLLLIQASLLGAAILALSGPFERREVPPGPARAAMIVLDVSASMQAKEGESTRFALAREAAVERIRELASEGEKRAVTIITAGIQPEVVGSGLDPAGAQARVERLTPVDTGANVTAAVELAATLAGANGTIDLFTDQAQSALVMSRDARAATRVHRFGTGVDNVSIASLRVQANPFEGLSATRVRVGLHSDAAAPRPVDLVLEPLDLVAGDPQGTTRVGATPVRRSLTLAPGATEMVAVDGLAWSGPFRARLEPGDALAVDDVVYGFVPPPQPLDVLLVSDDEALKRKLGELLRRMGRVTLRTAATRGDWQANPAGITILDRFTPPIAPPGNVLYLAPPAGNTDVTVSAPLRDVQFAEARSHELLRGVQSPETLLSGQMSALVASAGLRPILLGRGGGREVPLLVAGESRGRRVVATAFPLRAEALHSADGLPTLLLTINLLRWLSPTQSGAPIERLAGDRLRAGVATATPITRLDGPGGTRDLAPTEEVTLERAGIYRAHAAGRDSDLMVSFVDASESNVRADAVEAAREAPHAATAQVSADDTSRASGTVSKAWERISLQWILLLVVIVAALAEWLVLAVDPVS